MQGWVQLHRKLLEWEWFTSPKHLQVFIALLLKANHKENKWMGVEVKEGQLITGLLQLSEDTKLSRSTVNRILDDLVKSGDIFRHPTNKYSLITIIRWKDYQCLDTQINIKRNSNEKQKGTNNHVNHANPVLSSSYVDPDKGQIKYSGEHGMSIEPTYKTKLNKIYGGELVESGLYKLLEKIKLGKVKSGYENYLRGILDNMQAKILAKKDIQNVN